MRIYPALIVLSIALTGVLVFFISGYGKAEKETGRVLSGAVLQSAIDDAVISATVRSALLADPLTSDLSFKVKTSRGKVRLNGYIETQEQIDRTLAVAGGVAGVRGIRIVIGSGSRTQLADKSARQQADGNSIASAAANKARLMLMSNASPSPSPSPSASARNLDDGDFENRGFETVAALPKN